MTERITPLQFQAADGVEDWPVVGEGACTYFHTGSFAASARLVHAIDALVGPQVMPEVRVVVDAGSDPNRARPITRRAC